MKKIFLFILVFVCLKGFGQYPNMTNPQSLGAKKTRVTSLGAFDVDSILMGPTGCGSPSFYPAFLGVAVKKAAYYFDSCNHRFWVYDPKIQTWDSLHLGVAATGGGTDNANVGSGFRVLKPSTQELKTLFGSNTILIDSSSNTNGLTFKADTSLIATQYDISGFQNAISFPYTTLKYYTGYGTFGNLTDSVRAALSAGINILYSGGVISADTTTGGTKLATQGDIDRAITANIPTLQQVTTAGGSTNQPILSSSSFTAQVGSDYVQINYFDVIVTDGTNTSQIFPADITATNGSSAISYRNDQINFAGSGNPNAIKLFPIYHATQTDSVYLPHKGARKDTIAYLSDVRAGGGGAVSLSSVGGGDDIQTGGAGNIRTLNTSDFSVGTNLISIDYTNGQAASTSNKGFLTNTDWNTFNNKQAAFTSSEESFTGADLVSYDGTTGFALTVAHSPISTKNRDVFVNTVLVNSYITSISGSIFTIASLPYTISTSDIILIKYNY